MKAILILVILALSVTALYSCSCGYEPQPQWSSAAFTANGVMQTYCDGNCCNGETCNMDNCNIICQCKPGCWCLDRTSPWAAFPSYVTLYDQWCATTCAGVQEVDQQSCADICVRC